MLSNIMVGCRIIQALTLSGAGCPRLVHLQASHRGLARGPQVAVARGMPARPLDDEARKQLRETRAAVLETLQTEPDHFQALVIGDVLSEIDPDRDRRLATQRRRFRATRPADWKVRARALGLDRLLFHLARGWREAKIGRDVVPVLERRAAEISEARAAGVPRGHIDRSFVPRQLTGDPRVEMAFHPNGHLARVAIQIDSLHHGELVLDRRPGSGHFTIVEKRGGSGTLISERYRRGGVVTTLNTPWHDGEESFEKKSWTRWVEENLAQLARLSALKGPRRRCMKGPPLGPPRSR